MDDLNYLFHRQQVERSRADVASSEEARQAHLVLASRYEQQIEELSGGRISFQHPETCCPPKSVAVVGAAV
jgi:hypothetical protein